MHNKRKKEIDHLLGQAEKETLYRDIVAACEMVGSCWIYAGETDPSGYGARRVAGVRYTVSRIMLALATGESFNLPDYEACHVPQCPNRRCCNPAHLHWGTKAENCKEREQAKRVSHTDPRERLKTGSVYDDVRADLWANLPANLIMPEDPIEP